MFRGSTIVMMCLTCLVSCDNGSGTDSENTNPSPAEPEELVRLDTILNDTRVIIAHDTIHDILNLRVHSAQWDTVIDLTECLAREGRSLNPFEVPSISWVSNNFVGMRTSCGVPCDIEIVLPLKPGYTCTSYLNPYSSSDPHVPLSDDMIAYLGGKHGSQYYVKVKDLNSNTVDSIRVPQGWATEPELINLIDTLHATADHILIGKWDSTGDFLNRVYKSTGDVAVTVDVPEPIQLGDKPFHHLSGVMPNEEAVNMCRRDGHNFFGRYYVVDPNVESGDPRGGTIDVSVSGPIERWRMSSKNQMIVRVQLDSDVLSLWKVIRVGMTTEELWQFGITNHATSMTCNQEELIIGYGTYMLKASIEKGLIDSLLVVRQCSSKGLS